MKMKGECMKSVTIIYLLVLYLSISQANTASAGPYSDDLSKCVVESTTQDDRTSLVKWIFSAVSQHPAVKPFATFSKDQIENANRTTADLFTKLLTVSCKEQAQKAIQYEGEAALGPSFKTLGEVAMRDILTNPEVAAAMSSIDKYFDKEKFESTLGIKNSASKER